MSLVLLNFPTSFDSENRKPSIGRMTGPLSAGSFRAGEEGVFFFFFFFHLEQLLGLSAGERDVEVFFLTF